MRGAGLISSLFGLLALVATGPVRADPVLVFAAASLKTALDEVAAGFRAETGHDAAISYAGSSALARQIELGAPADVFLSANTDWMDRLEAPAFSPRAPGATCSATASC